MFCGCTSKAQDRVPRLGPGSQLMPLPPLCRIKGVPPLQQALAGLMERTFVRDVRINPEHVCLSVGCR